MILLSLSAVVVSACATPTARPADRRGAWVAVARPADPKDQTVRLTTRSWRWPLDIVHVTSTFGERSGTFHDGIDLEAPLGTSVHAAEEGRVVFAGSQIRGYGRMVVLKHPRSGLLSVYAHLQRPLVKEGQWVSRGQKIALSGQSGLASGPQLHFEIRRGVTPIDPAWVITTQTKRG